MINAVVLTQQFINGLAIGMAYALIAVGFSLVFGILRLVNFAHGAVYAFGAQIALVFIGMQVGVAPAILIAMVIAGLLGVLIDKTALQPLRKKKSMPIANLITTIGIAHILTNLMTIWFGSQTRGFPALFDFGMVEVAGVRINSAQLMMCLVALILMSVLTIIIHKSKIGLAIRATEQNTKAASLMGININLVISFTFFLAGASAAIAGGLIASHYRIVYPAMGFNAGLKAFSAAVLGGIGSLPGSIIGGLIVGVSESMAAAFLGSAYRDSVAFVILILVLIIRPTGLFGKKAIMKV